MTANRRLSVFALVVLVANVLAAALAVWVNWPSQFGGVGTDAGQDLLSRGTAISAPLAPVLCFILVAVMVRFGNWVGWLGVVLAFLTGVLVFVGGMRRVGPRSPPRTLRAAVLIAAGVVWAVIAGIFVVLGIAAARERLAHRDAT